MESCFYESISEEGGNRSARRKPSKSGWDRLKLNPHTTLVVEVEGVNDVRYASLTSQGVQHRVLYRDGHPSRYQPRPTGLNFGEQTGTGVFPLVIAVPHLKVVVYLLSSSQSTTIHLKKSFKKAYYNTWTILFFPHRFLCWNVGINWCELDVQCKVCRTRFCLSVSKRIVPRSDPVGVWALHWFAEYRFLSSPLFPEIHELKCRLKYEASKCFLL